MYVLIVHQYFFSFRQENISVLLNIIMLISDVFLKPNLDKGPIFTVLATWGKKLMSLIRRIILRSMSSSIRLLNTCLH